MYQIKKAESTTYVSNGKVLFTNFINKKKKTVIASIKLTIICFANFLLNPKSMKFIMKCIISIMPFQLNFLLTGSTDMHAGKRMLNNKSPDR